MTTRVSIEYPASYDAATWTSRHAAGLVPDVLPYGLQHLTELGYEVTYNTAPPPSGLAGRLDRAGLHRLDSLIGQAWTTRKQRRSATTDVVLCYDERTGFPAALDPFRDVPLISGIAWLPRPEEVPWWRRIFIRLALRRCTALFAQNRPQLEELAELWGVPAEKLHFVPVGIDTDFYAYHDFDARSETPLFVTIGADRARDDATVIAAVEHVRADWPTAGMHLATTPEMATRLSSSPPDWLQITTERLGPKARDLYRTSWACAVGLHPTNTGSGLTVILEAMAAGRPVIATDNPGLSDYIDDTITGYLVPVGATDAMAEAMTALLSDPQAAQLMGASGRARVEEQFTSKEMTSHIANIVDTIIAQSPLRSTLS